MAQLKTFLTFALGGVFAIFVLQNTDVVSIRFLFWELSMSRVILLPIIFLLGFILGFALSKRHR